MNVLTTEQALALINQRLQQPVTRQLFNRSIQPHIVAAGDATVLPKSVIFDARAVRRWAAYIAAREQKILAGEWAANRPYSVEDMQALTT